MRKLTREEFEEFIIPEYDIKGVTDEEIDTMYFFYDLGRQSVRW